MANQVSACMGQSRTHGTGGAPVKNPGGFTTSMQTGGTIGG